MAKVFLILNYVISSMVFSLILFPNLTSLKSIYISWMIWIQIQSSRVSTHLKITQALRISKVKSLILHFLLRTLNWCSNESDQQLKYSHVKCSQVKDIPTKVIKINKDTFANFITDHFNYCIANGEFPDELKHADVIPVHKKNEKCNKT